MIQGICGDSEIIGDVYFSVDAGDGKELVVENADEFKGIELVIVKGGKLIKPKQII